MKGFIKIDRITMRIACIEFIEPSGDGKTIINFASGARIVVNRDIEEVKKMMEEVGE